MGEREEGVRKQRVIDWVKVNSYYFIDCIIFLSQLTISVCVWQ